MVTPAELAHYIQVMRENNVLAFKHEGLEIALGPASAPSGKEKAPIKFSADQLLFAATEGLPEEEQ